MTNEPSLKLIEQNHLFPGRYVFKAIGAEGQGFAARVVAAVREELAAEVDPPHSIRATAAGRHVSVTLEPIVQTGSQVLAIYRRLMTVAGLKFLW